MSPARLTPAERALRTVSEAAWQATVLELAYGLGWRAHHSPKAGVRANGTVRRTRGTSAGFPDLVLVRRDRLVFAELKRETGPVRPGQPEWLEALAATGAESYLWRPSDLERVRAVLR